MRATKAAIDHCGRLRRRTRRQRLEHRVGDEQRQQHAAADHAAATNRSPLEDSRAARCRRRQHHQRPSATKRPSPCRTGAREFAELRVERREAPALGADQEAAGQHAERPSAAGQQPGALRRPGRQARRRARSRPATPPSSQGGRMQGLQQAVGASAAEDLGTTPAAVGILHRVPGQQQVGEQPDPRPTPTSGRVGAAQGWGGGTGNAGVTGSAASSGSRGRSKRAQRGSELTSFSQRAIRRRRSALAPYFA
jgi:hypothetical protein